MTHALFSRAFGAERRAVKAANMVLFGQHAAFPAIEFPNPDFAGLSSLMDCSGRQKAVPRADSCAAAWRARAGL